MNDFYFANPAHLYFGRSAVEELPTLIGEHKIMPVYGGKSVKVYADFLPSGNDSSVPAPA